MRLLFFKKIFFIENSTSTQPLVCNKQAPSAQLFLPSPFKVTSKVESDLNVQYLNDGCISRDPRTVLSNSAIIKYALSSVGLEKNSKCELLTINHTVSKEKPQTTKLFHDEFPSVSTPVAKQWQY